MEEVIEFKYLREVLRRYGTIEVGKEENFEGQTVMRERSFYYWV